MAYKLPDSSALGAVDVSTPTPSGRVPSIGTGANAVAAGIESIAGGIEKLATAETTYQHVTGTTDWDVAKTAALTDLSKPESVANYGDLAQRTEDKLRETAAPIIASVSNPKARFTISNQIEREIAGYKSGMAAKAVSVNQDANSAALDDKLKTYGATAAASLNDSNEEAVIKNIDTVRTLVQSNVATGRITATHARALQENYFNRIGELTVSIAKDKGPEALQSVIDKLKAARETSPAVLQAPGPQSGIQQTPAGALAFFQGKGLTKEQAAGVVGNLMQESGMDPNLSHDGGIGIGIAGWNKERRVELQKFAAANGKSENDYQTQLEFAWKELNGPEKATLDKLKTAKTPDEAAQIAQGYFRPGEPNTPARIKYAKDIAALPDNQAPSGQIVDATSQMGVGFKWGKQTQVSGFIIHHTGGGATAADTINTLQQRGLGAQYVIDRRGEVHQLLPDYAVGRQIINGSGAGEGLNNSNTVGVEVIAKNDKDVLPVQVAAAQKLATQLGQKYGFDPATATFGHGEVNPGHKEADEGMTITRAIRGGVNNPAGQQTASLNTGTATDATAAPPQDNSGAGPVIRTAESAPRKSVYNLIDPIKRESLINSAQAAQNALYIDQDRQAKAADAKAKAASEQSERQFRVDIIGGNNPNISAKTIVESTSLTREAQDRLLTFLDKSEKETDKDKKTYGDKFYDYFSRVHAPVGDQNRITDTAQLYPELGKGLTVAGLQKLDGEIVGRRTPDGEAEAKMKEQFFKNARAQITGTNEGMHLQDPKGDELFLKFMAQAFPAYAEGKKKGLSAAQLLSPDSPDYVGKSIAAFKRPANEWFSDITKDNPGKDKIDTTNPQKVFEAWQSGKLSLEERDAIALKNGWFAPQPAAKPQAPSVPVSR